MPEYDPPNAFYTQIDLPKYIKPEVFIGKEGCHLKRMTELSKCDYLWYDFKRGVIEVWGKEHRLPKALRMLKKRIDSFPDNKCPEYHEANDEYRIMISTIYENNSVRYRLSGSKSDTMKYYLEKILAVYPHNPYFTHMVSQSFCGTQHVLEVKRSNTSD
jgi:hypothetical protein